MPNELSLPESQMMEAEVALRLAFHLSEASPLVTVCLDCQHAESGGRIVFPVSEFLTLHNWRMGTQQGNQIWQGTYEKDGNRILLSTHSTIGDVVAEVDGRRFRIECKRGWQSESERRRKQNRTYHEAIGQLMTADVKPEDLLYVAVPDFAGVRPKLLAWQERPLMKQAGIRFAFVARDGAVHGLPF